jgi:hypothetical protein
MMLPPKYPNVRWSWPARILMTVALLASLALFLYSMAQL